jgi:transposase-like protein
MVQHRVHSIEFKRQVAQEFIAGETLHGLARRHDRSRNLIRIWVAKYEAGAFDEDARAADLLQEYEAKIAALERPSPAPAGARCADRVDRSADGRRSAGRLWSSSC